MTDCTDNKKSLTLSTLDYNINIDDFSADILKLIDANADDVIYTKFIRKFLRYIPIDYKAHDKIKSFGDFAQEAFKFFSTGDQNNRNIQIINIPYHVHQSITILINTFNKPFIIDSINNLMSQLSLQPLFIFHPVIKTTRDNNGHLVDIQDKGQDGIDESLVYIKILGNFNQKDIDKITDKINNVLDLVEYTYNAWQTLLDKITDVTQNINLHKTLYENSNFPTTETLDFLNWLQNDNITFLGTIDFDIKTRQLTTQDGVKEIWQENLDEILAIIDFSNSAYYQNKLTILGKINKLSPVHRNALIDYILIKKIDKNGAYISGTIIFGLYGTAMYFQSIKNIPILRKKMDYVLETSDFSHNGYNAKKIKNIIESLPRDVLVQIDEQDLYRMCISMLSTMRSHDLKLFIQQNWSNAFINVIIFLPRENLTPDIYNTISEYLSEKFDSEVITNNVTVVAQDFVHLFTTLVIHDKTKLDLSRAQMEKDLIDITANWSNELLRKLCSSLGKYEGSNKHNAIEGCFDKEYRYKFNATITIDDISFLEKASKNNQILFNFAQNITLNTPNDDTQSIAIQNASNHDNQTIFSLKIYSPNKHLTLSDTLPLIENLGFMVVDEHSFHISASEYFTQSWIYEFRLSSSNDIATSFHTLKMNIEQALYKINNKVLTSDALCKLIILSEFNWQNITLLKALTQYLHQTGFTYGKDYIQKTLVKHYKYSRMLMQLFVSRFDPKYHSSQNERSISNNMIEYLDSVQNSTEDKVLKNLKLIITAIVRTNFYRESEVKSYISFKFNSTKVPDLPLPIPYAEIFVYSNDFEGVHLRGGKVARGGLRWSDRIEDYRSEILGLMKSQMTKNPVIVPVGSKGGFCINFTPNDMGSNSAYMNKVISSYQNFLRGLLDVTDNIENDNIVHPTNTIIYDTDDSYLVVAADKGTANFSDAANIVSMEYGFWLGDAFASGGSDGYDHKKMGITAKGAWISVKSHFLDIGIDIKQEKFSVVAIGDMSGDVFGNGMLLSRNIKLIAAFNHRYIFIDPTPNTETSFAERQRLFKMQRSSWPDYSTKFISQGGAIFSRSAKRLDLSKEIQDLFNIKESNITPELLIRTILTARVDLIWNGGIGTYVKSSAESNIDICDKANDNIRINGHEVQAKIVVEGGNLGFSQLGRIEYDLNGGRINTDFIDNSAGVDCSDHEVNIKIALNSAIHANKITIDDRNKILADMTQSIEDLVLMDNYNQNLAITISLLSPASNTESFIQLIKELEKKGLLNASVEFLPSKGELSRRISKREGMTRPELAILLSYSKMSLEHDLSNVSFDEDPYFKKYLLEYFPKIIIDRFQHEIAEHPLRQEIIKTMIINKLVNQLGGTLISSIKRETGGNMLNIIKAYAIVSEIFHLDHLWQKTSELNSNINTSIKVEIFSYLAKITRRGISWFVNHIKTPMNITQTIEEFSAQTTQLSNMMNSMLVGGVKTRFFKKITYYTKAGVDKDFAQSIATFEVLVSAFDIIYIAQSTNTKNEYIANLYFKIGDLLSIDWLRQSCESQINESYWNRLSIQSMKDDLYNKQRRIVIEFVRQRAKVENLKLWLRENSPSANIFINFVEDLKMQDEVNLNMIILANKKLEIFLRKLKAKHDN